MNDDMLIYNQQQEILKELQKMRKLLLLLATRDDTQEERIIHLDAMGFDQLDIAHMLAETPGSVRRVLNEYYKNKSKDIKTSRPQDS